MTTTLRSRVAREIMRFANCAPETASDAAIRLIREEQAEEDRKVLEALHAAASFIHAWGNQDDYELITEARTIIEKRLSHADAKR